MSKITVLQENGVNDPASNMERPYTVKIDGALLVSRTNHPRRFATYAAAWKAAESEIKARDSKTKIKAREQELASMRKQQQGVRAVAEGVGCAAEPSAELRHTPTPVPAPALPKQEKPMDPQEIFETHRARIAATLTFRAALLHLPPARQDEILARIEADAREVDRLVNEGHADAPFATGYLVAVFDNVKQEVAGRAAERLIAQLERLDLAEAA